MESSKQKQMDKTYLGDVDSRIVIDDVSMAARNDIITLKYGDLHTPTYQKRKVKMDCKFRFAPAWSSGFSNENTNWQTRLQFE